MIYLELFSAFLKIGALSFGGGYGMISLIRETVLSQCWMSEEDLLNFIAVAESTPGPIAVNMATFIGSRCGGILGSLSATAGVVLPSFIIMLIIAALLSTFTKNKFAKGFLKGVRPCIVAMIMATAVTLGSSLLLNVKTLKDDISADYRGLAILIVISLTGILAEKVLKKRPSPILLILISAVLGTVLYGLF